MSSFSKISISGIIVCTILFTGTSTNTQQAIAQQTYSLPELSIDAEKSKIDVLPAISYEEIASEVLENKSMMTPNDYLKLNPSITLPGSIKGMGGAPSIRGFQNWSNQVLVDGTPITMPWANWANITTFPLRRMQKISIAHAGTSLIYGASGLAGAINITLPTARDLEGFTMTQELGGRGIRHTGLTYGNVHHNNQHLFGYFNDFTTGHQRHSEVKNETIMYRGQVETDNGWQFKVGILEMLGQRQLPDLGDPTMTPQEWPHWHISHRDVVATKDFGNNRSLVMRMYRNAEFSRANSFEDTTYQKIISRSEMKLSVEGQEILYNFMGGSRHNLTVGAQRRVDWQTGASVGGIDRRLVTTGFFVSDVFNAASDLDLHFVLRHDNHTTAGSKSSWSSGAEYRFNEKTGMQVSASRTLRFPAMRELYMTFIGRQLPNGNWTAQVPGQGDTSNKPETSDNFEAHVSHKFSDSLQAQVGYFSAKAKGLISRVINPQWPQQSPRFWWRNLEEVDIQGWEVRTQYDYCKNTRSWLGYTRFEKVDDRRTNRRLDARPSFKLNGGVYVRRGRLTGLVALEHVGEAPYIQSGVGPGAQSTEQKLKSSTRVDFTLRHELGDYAEIYVSIDNIANSKIQSNPHIAGAPPIYDIPRTTTLGLETRF